MSERFVPDSQAQVAELVSWALTEDKSLNVRGQGTKAGFGLPVAADCTVAMHELSGIVAYEPAELVMTAHSGTPLEEINAALATHRQHLAFEPMQLGSLYGFPESAGTVGGVFMGNLSGPRRFKAGAARDHILGIKAVNGRGEIYKSGGAVIKNVTGYDLSKLLAGSWGTLSIVTEITFKVMPAPAASTTMTIRGQSSETALATLSQLAQSPLESSGLAYVPAETLAFFSMQVWESEGALTAMRLEGSPLSVRERTRDVQHLFSRTCEVENLGAEQSECLWKAIRDVTAFTAPVQGNVVLRASIPPGRALDLVNNLQQRDGCHWYFDAAGSWCWIALSGPEPGEAVGALRRFIGEDGTLILYRAADEFKNAVGVLSMPPGLTALTERVKDAFDPNHIFNPGRLLPL